MEIRIQERQIRERATGQSYSRGQNYYQHEAIFDTARRGNEIEGRCDGSSGEVYHLSATLSERGTIEQTGCTCEYSFSGDCKHIVALLLTYLHEPELFEEFKPVRQMLEERSKEELIALILEMVEHDPDLKTLIDRPAPRSSPVTATAEPIDLVPFQRELRRAMSNFNHRGDRSAQRAVSLVTRAADDFANASQWRNAAAIYRTILEECTAQEIYPADDEGELIWALNQAVDGAIRSLEKEEIRADSAERGALIDRLVDIYTWNIEIGGYGLGEGMLPDALFQYLRTEDILGVRVRVQAAQQRKAQSEFGRWGVEQLEHFQMQLDALDNTDPEETLQRLREQGFHRLLFAKLITMGRVDEAIQVASQHITNSYERLTILPSLVDAGRSDVAIKLAKESLRGNFDYRIAEWLDQHYQMREERTALFEHRLWCMMQQPSVTYYAALKEAAEAVDLWARVRPDVVKTLEENKQDRVLAQLYLHDEEWDAAWETVERIAAQSSKPALNFGWHWVGQPEVDLEVAEKSKDARPHKAIAVFEKYARRQIQGRTRGHYSTAATYLVTVRELYQKIGDEAAWRELIRAIREEFRRLPALQDELNQAGL